MSQKSKYLPIVLGLSANHLKGSSKPFVADDAIEEEQKARILERDNHCCQYCGFQAEKYQKVNVKDGNWNNLSDDNLVTSCIFCQQCFYLDRVTSMRSGVLIWLPEMTQAALHHLIRAIYVARITQSPVAEYARGALDALMSRREDAKRRIQTDDPGILSMVMSDYVDIRHYKNRAEKLEGVRLLPLDRRLIQQGELEFNQFPQILAYWRSKKGPYGEVNPDQWTDLYQSVKAS
jgi:intracellular multiplication protein IcmJ